MDFTTYIRKNKFNKLQSYLLLELEKYITTEKYDADLFNTLFYEYLIANQTPHSTDEDLIPKYYTKFAIEPIHFISHNKLNFCAGNIVKYITRLGQKNSNKDELKKIHFYFDYLIHGNYKYTESKFKKQTLLIIGGWVSNLYSLCYGFMHNKLENYNVVVIEKGKRLYEREREWSGLTYGLFGSGAFSDNKNIFSYHEDQPLFKYLTKKEVDKYYENIKDLIHYFWPPKSDITISKPININTLPTKLTLKQALCIHLGTEKGYNMCMNMYEYLVNKEVIFITEAEFLPTSNIKEYEAKFIKDKKIFKIPFNKAIIGLGRTGQKTIKEIYRKYSIENTDDELHFGIRFECPFNKKLEKFVKNIQYDFKFSKDFDGNSLKNIRTFCVNHWSAEVVFECVEGNSILERKQANGHSIYKFSEKEKWTGFSNWAILGTFKGILAEELLVKIEEISKGNILEYTQTNFSLLQSKLDRFDYFGTKLLSFIEALWEYFNITNRKVFFPEIKVISPTPSLNSDFSIPQLGKDIRFIGDGGAWTRGIVPATVTGMVAIDTLKN